MENTYEIRLYDRILLTFSLKEQGIAGLSAHILDRNEGAKHLFPLDLELSDEGVLKWLRRRVIPKNRTFV